MFWTKREFMRLTCFPGTEMHCVGEIILSSLNKSISWKIARWLNGLTLKGFALQ